MAGTLVAMYVMRNYDVTEERAIEIRAEIDKRKLDTTPKLTSYYQTHKLLTFKNIALNKGLRTDIDFVSKTEDEVKQLFFKGRKLVTHYQKGKYKNGWTLLRLTSNGLAHFLVQTVMSLSLKWHMKKA